MLRNFSLHLLRFKQFHKPQFAALDMPHRFTPSISKSQCFLELISPAPTSSDKRFGLVNKPRRCRKRIIDQGRSGSSVTSSPPSTGILRESPGRLMPCLNPPKRCLRIERASERERVSRGVMSWSRAAKEEMKHQQRNGTEWLLAPLYVLDIGFQCYEHYHS